VVMLLVLHCVLGRPAAVAVAAAARVVVVEVEVVAAVAVVVSVAVAVSVSVAVAVPPVAVAVAMAVEVAVAMAVAVAVAVAPVCHGAVYRRRQLLPGLLVRARRRHKAVAMRTECAPQAPLPPASSTAPTAFHPVALPPALALSVALPWCPGPRGQALHMPSVTVPGARSPR